MDCRRIAFGLTGDDSAWLYADRTARCHRHHRYPGRPAPAGVVSREREIQAGVLHEQSPTNGHRYLFVRRRQPGQTTAAVIRPGPISGYWSLQQLSSFRLGGTSWPAGRGEAGGELGPALRRKVPADTVYLLLPKSSPDEELPSRFRKEIFRKRESPLAHVRGGWPGKYDLHVLPANGRSFHQGKRSQTGLGAGGQKTNAIERETVDGDRPHLHLGHHGPQERQESIRH